MKLSEAVEILKNAGVESPRHDAAELFSAVGGIDRLQLTLGDAECDSEELIRAVKRRAEREPLQYIIGRAYFYNEEYEVNESCLIPRSDTEILVEYAVKNLPRGARFLDLCTGSGCVGVSTLANTEKTSAVLVDISESALELAKRNAEKNGVSKRASFALLDVTVKTVSDSFFAVLSNPPYVADKVYTGLEREIFHEPRIAFVGGEDGGDFYRSIIPAYKEKIAPEGFIALEIGYDQGGLLSDIAGKEGMNIEIIKDYSGNDRVAVLRRRTRSALPRL